MFVAAFRSMFRSANAAECGSASTASTRPSGSTILARINATTPWCAPKSKTSAPAPSRPCRSSVISGSSSQSRSYQASPTGSPSSTSSEKPEYEWRTRRDGNRARRRSWSIVRTRRWTGRGIARRANELTDSRKVRAEGSRRRDDSLMPGQTQVTVPRVPILYLHHRPELGGAPRSLSYLLENLDTERFEPHVYCPGEPAAELFADCGAQVHIGPTATFTHICASSYHGRRWALLGVEAARLHPHLAELRRLLRIYRFPLVHLNDSPLVAAAWHVHRSRIALIWHLRGPLAGAENIRSRAIRMCVRAWADRAIAINDVVAESFADVPQTEVIFNSADLELFRPGDPRAARAAHGLDPERPAVGFFSYIYELKGYVDFIEAARICKDRGLEAQFLIVGSGVRDPMYFRTVRGRTLRSAGLLVDHERHARELVRTYKLDEVVRFIPYTRAPESLYVACDVVAAPSRGPELGRSVIEAAASGRPSVVTAPHGGGVVIPGETGLLATAASPNSLADALERLLKSDELRNRMGVNARRH